MSIPIIDLFAGPGGLGEGFTSVLDENNKRVFRIALSIEKDEFAHQTLTLRNFTRQFEYRKFPAEYYRYMRGEITLDELYAKYPSQYKAASQEAWLVELGPKTSHELVDAKIAKALKGEKNFIVIGGPPCQAYSLVGRARRQQFEGLNKEDPRVYLYREYYRILAAHNPCVFIMENVKGLLSSKVDNESVFNEIIHDLQNPAESYVKLEGKGKLVFNCPGYTLYSLVKRQGSDDLISGKPVFKPADFIIRTEEYGIPQTRHRVILLGVRNDLKITPDILQKAEAQIVIDRVLSGLPRLRSGISKASDSDSEWKNALENFFANNVTNEIDPEVLEKIKSVILKITLPQKKRGGQYIACSTNVEYNAAWYLDEKILGVCNHETRSHILKDLYRYLFVACYAEVKGHSPKLSDFPTSLLPAHLNVDKGISENKFADRFRVQLYGHPSKTVTSHISKDGHYFIHPDASQCRSLTVREAARVQTFPDNYYFCGPRTSQYTQVGNAVPPFLAYQIAEIVAKILA